MRWIQIKIISFHEEEKDNFEIKTNESDFQLISPQKEQIDNWGIQTKINNEFKLN